MTTKKVTPTRATKSSRLEVTVAPGQSADRAFADVLTDGLAQNGVVMVRYLGPDHGELSLNDMVASLRAQGEAVNRGDLAAAERMLSAQAASLNAIFGELARRAALNMGEYLDAADRYMRLALKAQSQSRATLETLAAIKNPPVLFAKQANINNGGQQQVNNGVPATTAAQQEPARTQSTNSQPNEVLEGPIHGSTQMDSRTAQATGREHSPLAAVATVNGAAQ